MKRQWSGNKAPGRNENGEKKATKPGCPLYIQDEKERESASGAELAKARREGPRESEDADERAHAMDKKSDEEGVDDSCEHGYEMRWCQTSEEETEDQAVANAALLLCIRPLHLFGFGLLWPALY